MESGKNCINGVIKFLTFMINLMSNTILTKFTS